MNCAVCATDLLEPIFRSRTATSVNSLSHIVSGNTTVWLCGNCGHAQSQQLANIDEFYDSGYNISLGDAEEDQVYEVLNGKVIYRHDIQMEILSRKIRVSDAMSILDFGCAKASMMKKIRSKYADVSISLFDVSNSYSMYWNEITPKEKQATYQTPVEWTDKFDLVTSFFAFEHIPDPVSAARHVASLLRIGGTFYFVVPYVVTNPGDFLVIDHVNHFTVSSIHSLLSDTGFGQIDIDVKSHRGAMVVKAVRDESAARLPADPVEIARVSDIASYWNDFADQLYEEENRLGDVPVAIYGAGFYGTLILSSLQNPQRVKYIADKSPYLQGKNVGGIIVIAPVDLANQIAATYVGLNPTISSSTRIAIGRSLGDHAEIILLSALD